MNNYGEKSSKSHSRNRTRPFDRRESSKQNRSKYRQDVEADDSSNKVQNEENKSRERRPPGLKGREIGMWYKQQSLARKESGGETSENKRNEPVMDFSIQLANDIIGKINEILQRNRSEHTDYYTKEFLEYYNSKLKVSFDDHVRGTLKGDQLKVHNEEIDEILLRELEEIEQNSNYIDILNKRKNLPIFDKSNEFLTAMLENQVVLVSGDTGCGKTTQIPQFILDYYIKQRAGYNCNIVCTQPRRIAAITVAERVAWERCEKLGRSVGYQIRLENVMPRPKGSILFCTTGTLLRQMESDPLLQNISHIILDEIHERSVETDILMALLKKIHPLRKCLKIVLMSATFCVEDFSRYFDNCPIITIKGTLFPVEEKFLEDVLEETRFNKFPKYVNREKKWYKYTKKFNQPSVEFQDMIMPYVRNIEQKYSKCVIEGISNPTSEDVNIDLVAALVFQICNTKPAGAILVFLPGYDTISKLYRQITESKFFNSQKLLVFPLHSMMATADQKQIFKKPLNGVRKIILATNIAETSVTIDDVVYVINSGKIKMQDYDLEKNFHILEAQWVTMANSKQRRGRAGRVQSGICYHLYTRARERLLDEFPTPEILRTRLEGIILSLKLLRIHDVRSFFTTLISVPHSSVIENSMKLLQRLNAINENEFITPLGIHLAKLPLDPQIGKMILMASIFKCICPITACAASLSFKDAFYIPLGKEKEVDKIKRTLANGSKSDHLMFANILEVLKEAKDRHEERSFCYDNFLSLITLNQLEKMMKQFCEILQSSRFLYNENPRDFHNNVNSSNENILRAVICAGLYPNVAKLKKIKRLKNKVQAIHTIVTPEGDRVKFHPSSINSMENSFESNYFVYYKKQKSRELYLYDTTMIHPLALILFGDAVQCRKTNSGKNFMSVANEFAFECNEGTSKMLMDLRDRIEQLLQKKALHPGPITYNTSDGDLLEALIFLLSEKPIMECSFTDEE